MKKKIESNFTLFKPELTNCEIISCHINNFIPGRFDLTYLAIRVTCLENYD